MPIVVVGGTQPSRLGECRGQIKELVLRAGALDIRDYELSEIERLVRELQPATLSMLSDATTLLDSLLRCCDGEASSAQPARASGSRTSGPSNSDLPFERAIDATMESGLGSFHAVEEITFIAQLELRQRAERLRRLEPTQGKLTLLCDCDSSLRRIRKALTAVDAGIATAVGIPPTFEFTSELQASLAVRRAYAKFRARVTQGGEPTPETLRPRIRLLGTQIAILVGLDIYPELRVRDRLLLRDLQERILNWLRDTGNAAPESGVRLWQDFAGCVEMFSLVNRRQELLEHDAAVLWSLREQLQRAPVDSAGPIPSILTSLQELEGLDTELDQLLEQSSMSPPTLQGVVQRLASQLLHSTHTLTPSQPEDRR